MKTNYFIVSAVIASAALLVSCQNNEIKDDVYIPEKGEMVFRLTDNARETKSESSKLIKGVTIDLGSESGIHLVLEETISQISGSNYGPETKGTPAYTENFTALYGDFKAAAFKSTNGTFETTEFDDGVYERLEEKDIWKRKYAGDLSKNLPLYFFLRAPYTQEGTTAGTGIVSGMDYDTSDGSISFAYTSPATAVDQKDLLFTSRKVTTEDYSLFIDSGKGVPVLFHHALSGVKFRIDNPNSQYGGAKHNISITSVQFDGLIKSGTCVITPTPEDGKYEDEPDIYSSSEDGVVDWTLGTATGSFSQEFVDTDFIEDYSDVNYDFGASFATAGHTNNVNDSTASKTFWFIPQGMTDNVLLTINFTIDGNPYETVINFGEHLLDTFINNDAATYWNAGELRTYTLRIDEVNLKIEDKVTMSGENNGYKDKVVITNTGNTDAFIRAAIVGQWLNSDGYPVFGFSDLNFDLHLVDSWYMDQFVSTADGEQGEFEGLPGYKLKTKSPNNGWYLCEDGYYYYTSAVSSGATTGQLFSKYTIKTPPDVDLSDVDVAIHFSLEIATQAISAKNGLDGSKYIVTVGGVEKDDWQSAWEDATGSRPVPVEITVSSDDED